MKDQHLFILGENHALHVYLEDNKYNGHIMAFPDYQPGSHIRNGSHLCDIPTQNSTDDAKEWALNYLGL